jgi:hypothetical protein
MATTQRFRRLAAILFALAGLVGSTRAFAGGNWMPLLPNQDFYDFQLFAPPDLQEYAIRPQPRDGIFFNYDRLYWGLTPPPVTGVGNRDFFVTEVLSPDMLARLNNEQPTGLVPPFILYGTPEARFDLNTSWMMTQMSWGNRYELGWIYDEKGFAVRYWGIRDQSQNFVTTNEFAVNTPTQTISVTTVPPDFLAPGFVEVEQDNVSPPPDHLISQTFTQRNNTELQSVSVAALTRRLLGRTNPVTFSLAGRFIQFADRYSIDYDSNEYPFPDSVTRPERIPLQHGEWDSRAYNNMVGPELGINLEKTAGRWTFGFDFRFTPAVNWQNNLYRGSNFPVFMAADYVRSDIESTEVTVIPGEGGTVRTANTNPFVYQVYQTKQTNATNSADHDVVFSPIGEWTLESKFRVSQAVLLRIGYTGTWMAGISRASSNTVYQTKPELVRVLQLNDPSRPPQTNSQLPNYNPYVARDRVVEYTTLRPNQTIDNAYVFTNGLNLGFEINY